MKSIIFVLHSLAIGGAERRLSAVANDFAAQGYDMTVLLLDDPIVKFEMHPAVKVVCINQHPKLEGYDPAKCSLFRMERLPKTSLREKLRLRKAHAAGALEAAVAEQEIYFWQNHAAPLEAYLRQRPEAIVVSFMTTPNIATMMAAKTLPNRVLFGDCTDAAHEYPADSPYAELRKKFYPRAQSAIFQTPEQRDYYVFLPKTKKYVIPNFIQDASLPMPFEGERRKEIVNFCHLLGVKNLPLLLDAFAMLHKDHPEYSLSIYGDGKLKTSLKERIVALGLSDCAVIHDADIHVHSKVLDAAMFVSSSDREGISNSMLEAMAIGLPCVCTDCAGGGARMMIEDHENGLLVPMRDAQALYRAMKELVENPALAEKLSRNAVQIRERLRPDVICRQMLDAVLGTNE